MDTRRRSPWARLLLAGTALLLSLLFSASVQAQGPAPERGPRHVDPRWHVLIHARVVTEPGEVLEDVTLVLREGVIVSLEEGGVVPPGARVWDYEGLTIYPGLIEAHYPVEVPAVDEARRGLHWNHAQVQPQRSALDGPGLDKDSRKELRELGFTVAALVPKDGLLRGTAAVVSIGEGPGTVESRVAEVLARDVYQEFSFARSRGRGGYPSSEMGFIALLRQTLSDAAWYADCWSVYQSNPAGHEPPPVNHALAALGRNGTGSPPLLFNASNELQLLRAAKVAREFRRPLLAVGCGTEFRRLPALVKEGLSIILPLSYPETPDVDTVADVDAVSLRDLMTWEQAPTNPRRLDAAGIEVALTTDKLDDRSDFPARLRDAIEHGLSEDRALAMLTTQPARLLGLEGRIGRVAPGMLANLVVVDGSLFDKERKIRDVWVGGRVHEIEAAPGPDRDGTWEAALAGLGDEALPMRMVLSGTSKLTVEADEQKTEARSVELKGRRLSFLLDGKALGLDGIFSFSAVVEDEIMIGSFFQPSGEILPWSATRVAVEEDEGEEVASKEETDPEPGAEEPSEEVAADEPADEGRGGWRGRRGGGRGGRGGGGSRGKTSKRDPASVPEEFGYPLGAYGMRELPSQETLLIEHATLWTCAPAGIIEDGSLLIKEGRIVWVGPGHRAPAADDLRVVDGTGLHLTPGLIDCHSHTGISGGVNEGGQRVTAEVRIEDVIDPTDVNWYRQLAGGLTAANQLHGSANAIGGQNSVVKLRFGVAHPDDMRLEGAPSGIKFALGENPKRVAAGTDRSDEYPQTRMGVETLIIDRLSAGRDYNDEWRRYHSLSQVERGRTMPPRRDLELEAMGEIVTGERLIHCHSYRQDEILMLCRVAEEFGFIIGTFQHVLEGYKVAEAIREVALGGSTFSDWWAYKFEVIDAIPFNATLMTDVGVVTSINSDSSEHARRLNTEAAKAMKYGGMAPEEALKLVTLNPAIQLAVSDRVGSLEPGKDADLALWSGNPLSYYSRCVATYVDGREMFSLPRHAELTREAERERSRIIQKILAADASPELAKGDEDEAAKPTRTRRPIEIALERQWYEYAAEMLRSGRDPFDTEPGDCGCNELQWRLEMRQR